MNFRKHKKLLIGSSIGLAVAIVAGSVFLQPQVVSMAAKPTFSNVQTIVDQKILDGEAFNIVEIVDDVNEGSLKYMVRGAEGFDYSEFSNNGAALADTIVELQSKGLLATNLNSNQDNYPLRYSLADADAKVVVSPSAEDSSLLSQGYICTGKYGLLSYVDLKQFWRYDGAELSEEEKNGDPDVGTLEEPGPHYVASSEYYLGDYGEGLNNPEAIRDNITLDLYNSIMASENPNGYYWWKNIRSGNGSVSVSENDAIDENTPEELRYNENALSFGYEIVLDGEGVKGTYDIDLYSYQMVSLSSNDLFAQFVLGLDGTRRNDLNINVNTISLSNLADDSELQSAINSADLLYLNLDGKDEYGAVLSAKNDISVTAQKLIFSRAYKPDDRLAVMFNYEIYNNIREGEAIFGDNLEHLAYLLLQPDFEAYYTSYIVEGKNPGSWEDVLASAIDPALNNYNFVNQNVFCVNYKTSDFLSSVYLYNSDNFKKNLYYIANGDFGNRYSNYATSKGFSAVYSAIQAENYNTTMQNADGDLMDLAVSPATVIAYILNYRDHNSIIYKTAISVLEIEPCRDYKYFADVSDAETAAKKKNDFIKEYAPQFSDNSEAVTIYGMTIQEFIGKREDLYEKYDIIYIGSQNKLFHTISYGGRSDWFPMDSYWDDIYVPGGTSVYIVDNWTRVGNTDFDTDYRYVADLNQWQARKKTAVPNTRELHTIEKPTYNVVCPITDSFSYRWTNGAWENGQVPPDGKSYVFCKYWGTTFDNVITANTPNLPGNLTDDFAHIYRNGEWSIIEPRYNYTEWKESVFDYCWYNGSNTAMVADANAFWYYDRRTKDHYWNQYTYLKEGSFVNHTDTNMIGMLYYHIGDIAETSNNTTKCITDEGQNNARVRFPGNDILDSQVDDFIDYLKSGSPIILARDFVRVKKDGSVVANSSDYVDKISPKLGTSYDVHGILDSSSYIYQFVDRALNSDAGYVGRNLLIENSEDLPDYYKADEISVAEAVNTQRMDLNVYSVPTPYSYDASGDNGIIKDAVYLSAESDGNYYLNFEFSISEIEADRPLDVTYNARLFVDVNNDGIYNQTTEELTDITIYDNSQNGAIVGYDNLKANTPYSAKRKLPDDYVGCIAWRLMATNNNNNYIHDSQIGYTAVPFSKKEDGVGGKVIHVLQVYPTGGGTGPRLEECTEGTDRGSGWLELLEGASDFIIDFDLIYSHDFAACFADDGISKKYYALNAASTDEERAKYTKGYMESVTNKRSSYISVVTGETVYCTGDVRDDYLDFYDYDMIILGFTDSYPNIPSKGALMAIANFTKSGKSILYSHDLSNTEAYGEHINDFNWTGESSTFTMLVREMSGMDRYGITSNWVESYQNDNTNALWLQNPLKNGSSTDPKTLNAYLEGAGRFGSDLAFTPGSGQKSTVKQTDALSTFGLYWKGGCWSSLGYLKYGNNTSDRIDGQGAVTPSGLCEVSMENSGVITEFPYKLDPVIKVANTHAQWFQLDLETDSDKDGLGDITVWYCMRSCTEGDFNDFYDYSPNDAVNNYYIYTKGNISYSGVGHSGGWTLDEKKLYINTFIAAYQAGVHAPGINIVDAPDLKANDLESVSLPIMEDSDGNLEPYTMYFNVTDSASWNVGDAYMRIDYYVSQKGSLTGVAAEKTLISSDSTVTAYKIDDGAWATYEGTKETDQSKWKVVSQNNVRGNAPYQVQVPLTPLKADEVGQLDVYVKVSLISNDTGVEVTSAFDRLIINKILLFDLD